uniref:Uncharacterized protein n=1 Tax=Cucumis melo TaxID=3656 RepID=A0A9I9EIE5_CUCME
MGRANPSNISRALIALFNQESSSGESTMRSFQIIMISPEQPFESKVFGSCLMKEIVFVWLEKDCLFYHC